MPASGPPRMPRSRWRPAPMPCCWPAPSHARPTRRVERSGETLEGGGFACIPWRAAGTHKGDAGGLPGTNRFVTLHGMHYVELTDGVISRARGFFDLYDAATQLGLLPSRGGLGES